MLSSARNQTRMKKERIFKMKKKPTLYIIIICVWLICVAFLGYSLLQIITNLSDYAPVNRAFIIGILSINTAILAMLWFGSIKDFIFSLTHAVMGKRLKKKYAEVSKYAGIPSPAPSFVLLYCTRNDFNKEALSACRRQKYSNFKTAILDDSDDPEYMKEIDRYAATHNNVEVIRRTNRTGYKAGNLNNYLKGRTDYDYFVVLDSDEVIPENYIVETIKYFNYNKKCGAVQARHTAQKGENVFQRLMGLCVGSNGATVQIIKNFYGANALIGHGMTISRECYEATGGFPLVVAEDISFAVDIKNSGYDIIYAPDILCYEEFPVNNVSLKKRQCKWTQGNLEYMKKYGKDITASKMSWFEKMDIRLSHYSLPIVPVLSLFLAICTIALGFLGYPVIRYAIGIYTIMLIFLCSPLIPDMFVYHRTKNVFLLIPYFILNVATYASLAPMMLKTVFLGLCGKKAVFLVTPKQTEKFTASEAIRYSIDSILFGIAIGALCLIACGSVLPVIFIVAGCLSAPFIILLSNIPVSKDAAATLTRAMEKTLADRRSGSPAMPSVRTVAEKGRANQYYSPKD